MKKCILLLCLFMTTSIFAQDLRIDTLSVVDSLTIVKVELTPEQLNIEKETSVENIVLKVFYNKNGSILKEFKKYSPVKNEITFFYAMNYEKRELEMKFIFDKKLKKIYSKKDFDQLIKIVEILEYKVFTIDSFSGSRAFSALENAF